MPSVETERRYRPASGRRTPQKRKPPKRGTPVRNGVLLAVLAVALAALVIVLPKDGAPAPATVLASGDGTQATAAPGVSMLRISEVMASNRAAFPDEKGAYPDWVEITNTGEELVSLAGVGLSDRGDRVLFLFPNITLAPGKNVIVFCDDMNQNKAGASLHARFKISSLGETIYLYDPSGIVIDACEVPALMADTSYALSGKEWIITEQFTPGYPNSAEGYAAFRAEAVKAGHALVINEICASNRTTLKDEDGEYSDWIELYNGGSAPIRLSDYALSDDEGTLVKWRFPQGAVIQPGEYYLVFASGKNRAGGDGLHPHTNFKLAAEGEAVILSDILSQQIDRTAYDNLGKDCSWGRVEGVSGQWQVFTSPTPGLPNNRASEIIMDRRLRASNTSGLFISEVIATNPGTETSYGMTSYDWIEIENRSDTSVNLKGYGLSDSVNRPRKWQFGNAVIPAGGSLLVFPSGLTESPTGSDAIHIPFRLSALGETLVLSDPSGNILDKLVVPRLEPGVSYGRDFDLDGLFYYDTPTAGKANAGGFEGYAPKPVPDVPGGIYTRTLEVSITVPEGTRVKYTLDGSIPDDEKGEWYEGPFTISDSAVLRARGYREGLKPSEAVTATYLMNVYHLLPVISLVTDPNNLYNGVNGILDVGTEEDFSRVPFDDAIYWEKTPYPGNFEFFTADGLSKINLGIELQLHGQFSLDHAQKSFRVTAKGRYGANSIDYAFFEDRPFTSYQSIILRNGGNDGRYTRVVDALQSKIVDWTDSKIIHMASTPAIVYLNGEYWGHYNLRERINKHSICAYEGWDDPENIDFIKGGSNALQGTMTNYRSLIKYVKEHDLAKDPEALQTVLDWIDIDSCFDFYIFQMYFANTDAGNIKMYRQRQTGSKWHWILYDLDWGYYNSANDGCFIWLDPKGAGSMNYDNTIIRKLLEVPELRDQFLKRYGYLYQNFFKDTPRVLALLDSLVLEIEPELTMHFIRWAGEQHPAVSEEPVTPEGNYNYWAGRVTRLRRVIKRSPNLAWGYVQAWFELTDAQMLSYFGERPPIPEDAQ